MSIREIKIKDQNVIAFEFPGNLNNEIIGNKLDDFEILQILGEGSFGFVAKVKSKINSKIYALKKMRPVHMSDREKMQFKIENIFSHKLNHPNVTKFLYVFEENGEEHFIMKYFNSKDLFRYLVANSLLCLVS